ncbi:MAG: ribosome-associated translation inhibitor RaiA [Myxococcota bacterium]
MNLAMTFRNLEGTDAMRNRANKKFSKLTRFLDESAEAHMVCSIQRHRHTVELTVSTDGETLRTSDTSDDMYTSIDAVMNAMAQAARRHRERIRDRRHQQGPDVAASGGDEADVD